VRLVGDGTSVVLGDGDAKAAGEASLLGFLLNVWLPVPVPSSDWSDVPPPLYGRIDTLNGLFTCQDAAAFFFGLRGIPVRASSPERDPTRFPTSINQQPFPFLTSAVLVPFC